MRFQYHFLIASALIRLTAASPIAFVDTRSAFTIPQTVPKPFIQSGPAAMAAVYSKFGKAKPADVKAAAANNTGTVSATPQEYESYYLCPVTIGGQTLNLNLDTGSADLWVFSSQLSAVLQNGHSVYDPSKSSTAELLDGETWNIGYGDGSGASGNVYLDTVEVGNVSTTNQAVELAQSISVQFQQDVDNDGIFGLGFSNINTVTPTQQKTFFDNVKDTLALPLFTANLLKGTPGSYDFGFIDSSKHTGNITYVGVDSANGFWGVISKGFAVGSGNFTFSLFRSIVDTGTTLLLLPVALVSAYYARVSGARYDIYQGGYTFPCSTFLPAFTLGFEEYRAVVPGSYINYAPLEDGTNTCYGGIQRNTGIGFSIIGDVFIKSQFIVFDSRGPRLGIAPKTLFNIDY
ncbi:MAG: hypothetical protein Q9164_005687 [Protoblastenia rupestris]